MSSIFDMNQPSRICPVCMELHPPHNPCKYDTLVKTVHELRKALFSALAANREAVDTAKAFQKIIVDAGVEIDRLLEIEDKYKAMMGELNGPTELPAETPPPEQHS